MRPVRMAVVVVAVAFAANAQKLNESITVSLVEVPVTVVDSSGNPVRGLTAANFKLFDQGKEVAVNGIDTIDFASREAMGAVSPLNPVARRKFLLLFDLAFSKPSSLARAQEAARQFVAKSVQPRDLVGVGSIDNRGFHLAAAFTTDRKLVADAIAKPGQARMTNDPLHLGRVGDIVEITDMERAKGQAGAGSDNIVAIMNSAVLQNKETVRAEVEKQMDFLGDLAKMLRSIPGRKQLVFLSEGFDSRIVSGTEAREDLGYAPSAYSSESDKRFGSSSASSALQRMAQVFRGSDVVLHALDIQGIRVEGDVREGASIGTNDALRMLAQPTGGMVFKNVNKIETDFERMMHTQEVVYVLSFQAPSIKPGRFHDLKVKLVNVPGGAQAFARAGYYETGGETQAAERTMTNAEIIMNDVEQKDLRTASLAAAFPTSSNDAQVPVIVEVNGADLMLGVKENKVSVDMYIYAFDEEGTVRDRLYQQVGLDLGKVGSKLRANGLKYWATLALPPGKYAVKTLVTIPATSRKGFSRADVVVPEANQLAAAPVFVEENPNWVLVKGTSHDKTSAAYPFDLSGEHFIPAATHRTKRFAVFLPNTKPEDVTFETKPKLKYLGAAKSAGATALVMEVEKPVTDVELTIRKKGVATPEKIPLHLQ
jgi:VWFA-related protein